MSISLRGVVFLLAVPTLIWACGKQNEGERCDSINSGNEDCASGLVCVRGAELLDDSTDRCCPPEGQAPTDDRCLRSSGVGGTGGTDGGTGGTDAGTEASAGAGGSSGSAGSAGAGGSSGGAGTGGGDGGTACSHSSQCPGTQVCGPSGTCQVECLGNKDCMPPETCDLATNTCEAPPPPDAGTD